MPAQANATVTAVTGSGQGDDWDRAGSAGAAKWAGQARAYWRETSDRVQQEGRLDVLERRELILDTADVDAMDLDTDDTITITVDGQATPVTAKAQAIRRARLAGIPSALATTKITLTAA